MEFLTQWFKRDIEESGSLKERKVVSVSQIDIIRAGISKIEAKKRKNKQDKARLRHLKAQLDKLERFERWKV